MAAQSKPLDNQEKKARLRLIRSENVGPITFSQLLLRFGSAEKALAEIPKLAANGGATRKLKICLEKDAIEEAARLRDIGGRFLHKGDIDYPPLLATLEDAPPILSLLGNAHLTTNPSFAIVGARNASTNAKRLAQQFAGQLGLQDMMITSGLARGIDSFAHKGALQSGTIAVVAGGVDIIYPKENTELYNEIIKIGAIISEMPLGISPQARHFPRRNRIISGMSWGLLVVEAALKSGSLITARYAADQGRDVFALPGSPMDARCKGTNDLIRNGAHLCETIEDIINIYATQSPHQLSEDKEKQIHSSEIEGVEEKQIASHRDKVVEAIGYAPVSIDDVLREVELPFSVLWVILMELELAGKLERLPGGRITLLINAN